MTLIGLICADFFVGGQHSKNHKCQLQRIFRSVNCQKILDSSSAVVREDTNRGTHHAVGADMQRGQCSQAYLRRRYPQTKKTASFRLPFLHLFYSNLT
jgi:hypothetical protein